jgi:hypothetical protein
MDEVLRKIYYNTKIGYCSAKRLNVQAVEELPRAHLSLEAVQQWLDGQSSYQRTKRVSKPRAGKMASIDGRFATYDYQVDILVYERYEYDGFKYILMVADVYSRFLMARPLKSRNMQEVVPALMSIFEENGLPSNLTADNEFNNSHIEAVTTTFSITPHFSQVDHAFNYKQAIVERLNGTIAQILQRYRLGAASNDWPSVLPDVVANYNNSEHSTIGAKPVDVFNEKHENSQIHTALGKATLQAERYGSDEIKVGDQVRVKEHKGVFDKGDRLTHTDVTYSVESVEGQRVRIKNNRDELIEHDYYRPYELLRTPRQTQPVIEKIPIPPEVRYGAPGKARKGRSARSVRRELGDLGGPIVTSKRIPRPNRRDLD